MGPGQPKPTSKRLRKRKRRVMSSSSSEDSSLPSSGTSTPKETVRITVRQPKPSQSVHLDESEDEDISSSDGSSGEEVEGMPILILPVRSARGRNAEAQHDSEPPGPNVDIPPFIPTSAPETEQLLKDKFRKFWMASIAEGFKDDLEEIRKEPNLSPSRLALLIESLASGADVFSSKNASGSVNEMEVVLNQVS